MKTVILEALQAKAMINAAIAEPAARPDTPVR